MAATVKYRITEGTPPFTVSINPTVAPPQTRLSIGEYYFFNIPDGYYTITVVDSLGFEVSFDFSIYCELTTTTTLEPTTTTTTTTASVVECLDGLVIEAIYVHTQEDLEALPEDYVHPCPESIGLHSCARALFEIFALSEIPGESDICVGGLRLNNYSYYNDSYVCPCSGYRICHDYENRSEDFEGVTWENPITRSRYDKIVITGDQALAIANATSNSTTIRLAFLGTSNLYGISCGNNTILQHEDVTWLRISKADGELVYNGCPQSEDVFEVDVCGEQTSTTTTTILQISTTSTTTIYSSTTSTTTEEVITTTTTTTQNLETLFIHIPNS